MFRRVLVLNRGEIACRIARTVRRLGSEAVMVYSDADRDALHTRAGDEAYRLGAGPVRESYMNLEAVEAAVRTSAADAVHPGYGLLSENAELARTVTRAGAVFIGPEPDTLELLGDKIRARALARAAGVEPPPGTANPVEPDAARLAQEAKQLGYPLIVKAAAGGGGIGMAIVRTEEELLKSAKTCSDRALQAFADGRIYLERYLERPRHIEVQILADAHGNVRALGERECSVQRRHQKVVEETPSPAAILSGAAGEAQREQLCQAAERIAHAANYRGAGTVEFILDAHGTAFFLEVNARLQVEHPVTELVTGLDLVEQQLRIAGGEALSDAVRRRAEGHAIELRVYAEDPARGFLPQPGRVVRFAWPEGAPGLRVDSGVAAGNEISTFYDPLLAKVAAHGPDRETARQRLLQALSACEVEIQGPKGPRTTNLALLRAILAHPEFVSGEYDTGLMGRMGSLPS
ncbi:MAG TPA: biotin carboxylase N-terminal domain-containing protein [Polyangiaceae bacterium]|nr:biotin carboxylase N-terminal domain-containing protein [Polyangiaceae bacterium]